MSCNKTGCIQVLISSVFPLELLEHTNVADDVYTCVLLSPVLLISVARANRRSRENIYPNPPRPFDTRFFEFNPFAARTGSAAHSLSFRRHEAHKSRNMSMEG